MAQQQRHELVTLIRAAQKPEILGLCWQLLGILEERRLHRTWMRDYNEYATSVACVASPLNEATLVSANVLFNAYTRSGPSYGSTPLANHVRAKDALLWDVIMGALPRGSARGLSKIQRQLWLIACLVLELRTTLLQDHSFSKLDANDKVFVQEHFAVAVMSRWM